MLSVDASAFETLFMNWGGGETGKEQMVSNLIGLWPLKMKQSSRTATHHSFYISTNQWFFSLLTSHIVSLKIAEGLKR